MTLERRSGGKVNLLLNILGKRADGFHELETIFQPVPVYDHLHFTPAAAGIELTCNDSRLPTDSQNLVFRAATAFFKAIGIPEGVRIHLDKHMPLAAGLGGGSSNAATTLLALNDLYGKPLTDGQIQGLAATLGSDVPFFVQAQPALGTGRGEQITPLAWFPALYQKYMVLIHPGFGVSSAWAYQQLARFPQALPGQPGRAQRLIQQLHSGDLVRSSFYNTLEIPVLAKYPLLALFQEFLKANGAEVALMSGSGSSTFALVHNQAQAEDLVEKFKGKFGQECWTSVVALQPLL